MIRDLQSLIELTGVSRPLAPNSGGTRVGSSPELTRAEFVANLQEVISRSDRLSQADLKTLQRLETEFGAELGELRKHVAQLEARAADIDDRTFSTTTKLRTQGGAAIAIQGSVARIVGRGNS